jgi:nitrogen fixation protein FixH
MKQKHRTSNIERRTSNGEPAAVSFGVGRSMFDVRCSMFLQPLLMTRNLWPLGIILTFVIFIGGTVGLVILACHNPADLVSANYYEDEVRFQTQMDRLDRTRQLDSPATVTCDAGQRRITISLPTRHAQAASEGCVELYRPSESGLDRRIKLETDSNGIQTIDTSKLKPGSWKVKVTWKAGGEDFFLDQNVVVEAKDS